VTGGASGVGLSIEYGIDGPAQCLSARLAISYALHAGKILDTAYALPTFPF